MSLVVLFSPESLTSDQYDHVVRRLDEENISPADGLDYEVCFGSGDKMKVSLVWDSKEHFDAFAARLVPILAEFGIDPGEPECSKCTTSSSASSPAVRSSAGQLGRGQADLAIVHDPPVLVRRNTGQVLVVR
jgi:hypothetical protein